MNEALVILQQVIIMFLLISVGTITYKIKMIDEKTVTQLTSFLLKIVIPCLIISSLDIKFTPSVIKNIALCTLFIIIGYGISILATIIIYKDKAKYYIQRFASIFSNCGYMGIPLVNALYGQEGVLYAGIMQVLFNLIIWTYGISLFPSKTASKKTNLKKIFINPGTVGFAIGIFFLLLPFNIPDVITQPIKTMGEINTPLAMVIIGACLAKVNPKQLLTNKSAYLVTLLRLILIPVLCIALLYPLYKLTSANPTMIKSIIFLFACPTGANLSLFAKQMGTDTDTQNAITYISITTLLSILSIPLIGIIANMLFV